MVRTLKSEAMLYELLKSDRMLLVFLLLIPVIYVIDVSTEVSHISHRPTVWICVLSRNARVSSAEPGSEERATPSSEHQRLDTSRLTSHVLPHPGRNHATPPPRTHITIQRDALSPGRPRIGFPMISLVLRRSLSSLLQG